MTMTRRIVTGASVVCLLTLTVVRAQEPPARAGGAGGSVTARRAGDAALAPAPGPGVAITGRRRAPDHRQREQQSWRDDPPRPGAGQENHVKNCRSATILATENAISPKMTDDVEYEMCPVRSHPGGEGIVLANAREVSALGARRMSGAPWLWTGRVRRTLGDRWSHGRWWCRRQRRVHGHRRHDGGRRRFGRRRGRRGYWRRRGHGGRRGNNGGHRRREWHRR